MGFLYEGKGVRLKKSTFWIPKVHFLKSRTPPESIVAMGLLVYGWLFYGLEFENLMGKCFKGHGQLLEWIR